jgi:alkanesulfonate monooxygenase SsuD/methylene tetrahydromethanopterin reductase-like flavin-dependent oxidoreductase (luciferase family)
MAATLDIISGGRLELGLGAGWNEEESSAYGIELGSVTDRLDRFEEGLAVIVGLLSDTVTNFSGRFFTITDARCEPKGPQRPHPPITIGGTGRRRTLRIAARFAQRWDAGFPADVASWLSLRDTLHEHCAALGRDPAGISTSMHLVWSEDSEPAHLAARAHEFAAAGVDQVVFSMRAPYRASALEPLAAALVR